ncbi:hypothetical protein Tco_0902705 [Tanacetum coccineum]
MPKCGDRATQWTMMRDQIPPGQGERGGRCLEQKRKTQAKTRTDIKVKKNKNKPKPTRNEETSDHEKRYQSRISPIQEKRQESEEKDKRTKEKDHFAFTMEDEKSKIPLGHSTPFG